MALEPSHCPYRNPVQCIATQESLGVVFCHLYLVFVLNGILQVLHFEVGAVGLGPFQNRNCNPKAIE